jgi:Leucine-rich repeat (LRR) protein
MKSLRVKILFFLLIGNVLCKALNKSLLINEYSFGTDSVVIDLSVESIDSIHLNTFNEYAKLEELYLEDNKLTRLEAGLFSNLVNLRELWLESNQLVSIDKNIFNGLINLELVCLSNNPISILFTDLTSLCGSTNSKCKIKTKDRCQRKVTTRTTTLATITSTITSTSTTLLTTNSSINIFSIVFLFTYSGYRNHSVTFKMQNSIINFKRIKTLIYILRILKSI